MHVWLKQQSTLVFATTPFELLLGKDMQIGRGPLASFLSILPPISNCFKFVAGEAGWQLFVANLLRKRPDGGFLPPPSETRVLVLISRPPRPPAFCSRPFLRCHCILTVALLQLHSCQKHFPRTLIPHKGTSKCALHGEMNLSSKSAEVASP